jgi:hypothetical protein
LDPTTETPTSSLLRRTTKPNLSITQPDLDSDRIVLSDDLRLYIRHAWHVVEPSTVYLENWHIDLIADYLQAVTAGQIKRLLITSQHGPLSCSAPILINETTGHLVAGDGRFDTLKRRKAAGGPAARAQPREKRRVVRAGYSEAVLQDRRGV